MYDKTKNHDRFIKGTHGSEIDSRINIVNDNITTVQNFMS